MKEIDRYTYYCYSYKPLLSMGIRLDDSQKLNLINAFTEWYGNTDQDTDVYGFEAHLVTRMILSNHVVINPQYLMFSEVLDELCKDYLPEESADAYKQLVIENNQG